MKQWKSVNCLNNPEVGHMLGNFTPDLTKEQQPTKMIKATSSFNLVTDEQIGKKKKYFARRIINLEIIYSEQIMEIRAILERIRAGFFYERSTRAN